MPWTQQWYDEMTAKEEENHVSWVMAKPQMSVLTPDDASNRRLVAGDAESGIQLYLTHRMFQQYLTMLVKARENIEAKRNT